MVCPGVGFDVIPTDCLAAALHHAMPEATDPDGRRATAHITTANPYRLTIDGALTAVANLLAATAPASARTRPRPCSAPTSSPGSPAAAPSPSARPKEP
ncbi:hypothetical protein AB0C69_17560 [Actinomadura sp. NPDC048032]|uniref:hypothetical protein n=1 Tax=Actinomadura sp. NPDC048032 TaxID=3155747 RepID=UPI0033D18AB6